MLGCELWSKSLCGKCFIHWIISAPFLVSEQTLCDSVLSSGTPCLSCLSLYLPVAFLSWHWLPSVIFFFSLTINCRSPPPESILSGQGHLCHCGCSSWQTLSAQWAKPKGRRKWWWSCSYSRVQKTRYSFYNLEVSTPETWMYCCPLCLADLSEAHGQCFPTLYLRLLLFLLLPQWCLSYNHALGDIEGAMAWVLSHQTTDLVFWSKHLM